MKVEGKTVLVTGAGSVRRIHPHAFPCDVQACTPLWHPSVGTRWDGWSVGPKPKIYTPSSF